LEDKVAKKSKKTEKQVETESPTSAEMEETGLLGDDAPAPMELDAPDLEPESTTTAVDPENGEEVVKASSPMTVPGLELLPTRATTFWCIGKPLVPGKPLQVALHELSEAQKLEIETKVKGQHITVQEIEIEVEVDSE